MTFLKAFYLFIIIVFTLFPSKMYSEEDAVFYYKDNYFISFAARIDLSELKYLKAIDFNIAGNNDKGCAKVRIFGNEAGANIPIVEKDLIPPIIIKKSRVGFEKIRVALPDILALNYYQIFIVFEPLSDDIFLSTDKNKNIPSCENSLGEKYFNQVMKNKDGQWILGAYSFDINLIYEDKDEDKKEIIFDQLDLEKAGLVEEINNNQWINIADINDDNYKDIVYDGRLFINNCGNTFKEVKDLFRLDKHRAKAHCIIDVNDDELQDIIVFYSSEKDSGEAIQKTILFLNKYKSMNNRIDIDDFEKLSIDLPSMNIPRTIVVSDLNNDEFSDLIIIPENSGKYNPNCPALFLLNNKDNSFEDYSNKLELAANIGIRSCVLTDLNNDGFFDLYFHTQKGLDFTIINHGNIDFELISNRVNSDSDILNSYLEKSKIIASSACYEDMNYDGISELFMVPAYSELKNYQEEAIASSVLIPDYSDIGISMTLFYKFEIEQIQSGICVEDFDNNSFKDIILSTNMNCRRATFCMNYNNEYKQEIFNSGFGNMNLGINPIAFDFNNDGKSDFVTIENNELKVFKNILKDVGNYVAFSGNDIDKISKVEINTDKKTYKQKYHSLSSLYGQKTQEYFIGLGDSESIDSVILCDQFNQKYIIDSVEINNIHEINDLSKLRKYQDSDFSVNVFPNPFIKEFSIKINSLISSNCIINITDMAGQSVIEISKKIGIGENTINWNGKDKNHEIISNGVYFININICDKKMVYKVVKID